MICSLLKMISNSCLHESLTTCCCCSPVCTMLLLTCSVSEIPQLDPNSSLHSQLPMQGTPLARINHLKPLLYLSVLFVHLSLQYLRELYMCKALFNNLKPLLLITKPLWSIKLHYLFLSFVWEPTIQSYKASFSPFLGISWITRQKCKITEKKRFST